MDALPPVATPVPPKLGLPLPTKPLVAFAKAAKVATFTSEAPPMEIRAAPPKPAPPDPLSDALLKAASPPLPPRPSATATIAPTKSVVGVKVAVPVKVIAAVPPMPAPPLPAKSVGLSVRAPLPPKPEATTARSGSASASLLSVNDAVPPVPLPPLPPRPSVSVPPMSPTPEALIASVGKVSWLMSSMNTLADPPTPFAPLKPPDVSIFAPSSAR